MTALLYVKETFFTSYVSAVICNISLYRDLQNYLKNASLYTKIQDNTVSTLLG